MAAKPGDAFPQRVPEHKWLAYFEGLKAGLSRFAASQQAGISLSTVEKLHADPTRSSGFQLYKDWLDANPRDVVPRNRLNNYAKKALKDFGFFRERYFGHISRPWHVEAANAMLEMLYSDDKKFVVVNCPPGCLTGDTVVAVNRAGKSKQMRLDHVEHMFNGGAASGRTWSPDIPTYVSRAADGHERLGLVRSVYPSGIKRVYALTTASGRTIRASAEHPFQRPDGTYTDLGDLRVGDAVMVLGGGKKGVAPKKHYASLQTAHHPNQRKAKDGHRYWTHRLTMEAHLNGLSLDDYIHALRAQPLRCKEFHFLGVDDVVHHLDEDHTNNALSNLALTTQGGHRRIHAGKNSANVWRRIVADEIVSITDAGEEMTYDVEMADDPHNFLANGLVVHNSGKTTLFSHDLICWLIARDRGIRCMIGTGAENTGAEYTQRIRTSLERLIPIEADETEKRRGLAKDSTTCLVHDFGRFKPEGSAYWRADKLVVAREGGAPAHQKEASVVSYGRKSTFLGGRFNFVMWDDVVTDQNSRDGDDQDKLARWWRNTAESRLEPGGLLILQGQRLSAHDLYRHVLDLRDISAAFDGHYEDDDENFDPDNLPRKYHHIVFKAHDEEKCKGGRHKEEHHNPETAKAWPQGCLLDPLRLTYKDLMTAKYNDPRNYATVYQQEDTDPGSVLVNPLWINGGVDSTGTQFPGCWDNDRMLGEWPKNLAGETHSVVTADPSGVNFWGVQWWAWQADVQFMHLVDLKRQRMAAPDLLDWNASSGMFTGLLEEWWQRSRDIGKPISHVIVEINAAQRFLLQYDHAKRWASLRGVDLVGHSTQRNKSDKDLGVPALAPFYRFGRARLPGHPMTKPEILPMYRELTRYPESATTDCVMANWFLINNAANLFVPRPKTAPQFARPTWIRSRSRGVA